MIELLLVFAVLAAIWGVIGSRSGAAEETTTTAFPTVVERGSAARRLIG